MSAQWRVGKYVALNVYDGDRPVCQCHTAIDARRIVKAVNAVDKAVANMTRCSKCKSGDVSRPLPGTIWWICNSCGEKFDLPAPKKEWP